MSKNTYRKPGGPMETLDKLRVGRSILVDRVTANRIRATASQRGIPYKSFREGDMIRIKKL